MAHIPKKPRCQSAAGLLKANPHRDLAATYSPTFSRSTIGAAGLNYSVRYGKRCFPCAIATKNSVSYSRWGRAPNRDVLKKFDMMK